MNRLFRKKPVVVNAYQVTRELLESLLFENQPYPAGLKTAGASYNRRDRTIFNWRGVVTTIHNQDTYVIENDWVITEPNGEFNYICKPDIFEATYEGIENEN